MTRKIPKVGAGLVCGMLAVAVLSNRLLYICAAVFALTLVSLVRRRYRRLAVLIAFIIGMGLYMGAVMRLNTASRLLQGHVRGNALVCDAATGGTPYYTLRCTLKNGQTAYIGYYCNDAVLSRGDIIALDYDTLDTASNSYYRSQGVAAVIYSRETVTVSKENGIFRQVKSFRDRAAARIRALGMGDSGELMVGMIFGSRFWDLSFEGKNTLYGAGIGHIASVSGLHTAILAGMLSALLGRFGRRHRRIRAFLLLLLCTGIALLTDFTPSVLRSAAMILAIDLAALANRRADGLTSLFTALIAMLTISPLSVTSASLVLSACGAAGAGMIAPRVWEALSSRYEERKGSPVPLGGMLSAALASVCASLCTLPVSFCFFDEVPLVSPLANILLSSFTELAVGTGAVGVLLSAGRWTFVSRLSDAVLTIASFICKIVLGGAELFSHLPKVPSGYVSPWGLAVTVAAAFAVYRITRDRRYWIPAFMVTASAMALSGILGRAADTGRYLRIVSDSDSAAVIYSDKSRCAVFDFDSGAAYDTQRALKRYGLSPSAVFCGEENRGYYPSNAAFYPISPGEYLIDDDMRLSVADGYAKLCIDGMNVMIVNSPHVLPRGDQNLVIYNCDAAPSDFTGVLVTPADGERVIRLEKGE